MLSARRRSTALVALAAIATTVPVTVTADGWTTLFTSPTEALGGFVGKHVAVSRKKVVQLATCVWHGSFERRARDGSKVVTTDDSAILELDVSGRLDGEDSVRTYPAYPHAPVLVGVASCDSVALRWKSIDDAAWPVHRVVLQRFPDHQHRRAWATLLETNDSVLVDAHTDARVHPGARYSYRVQVLSTANTSSAYAFQDIALRASACSSRTLFGLVPAQLPAWSDMLTNWSCEAVRTLALLILCFLSVFALMRARVTRMHTTRARQSRLKRIHKSAAECSTPRGVGGSSAAARAVMTTTTTTTPAAAPSRPKLADRSSSESSSTTSPSSEALDAQLLSARSIESLSSVDTRESFDRESSLAAATADDRASTCQHCQKRFGIFRRRHMCDICRAVTLCRKCGYQAPVGFARASALSISAFEDAAAAASAAAAGGRRSSLTMSRESVLVPESERKVKIKTICRGCCEDVYRYSTAMRPSLAQR